jgi:hypothetical protein
MSMFPKVRQKLNTGSDWDATGPQLFLCGQSRTQVTAGDTIEDLSNEWHVPVLAWSIIRKILRSIGTYGKNGVGWRHRRLAWSNNFGSLWWARKAFHTVLLDRNKIFQGFYEKKLLKQSTQTESKSLFLRSRHCEFTSCSFFFNVFVHMIMKILMGSNVIKLCHSKYDSVIFLISRFHCSNVKYQMQELLKLEMPTFATSSPSMC